MASAYAGVQQTEARIELESDGVEVDALLTPPPAPRLAKPALLGATIALGAMLGLAVVSYSSAKGTAATVDDGLSLDGTPTCYTCSSADGAALDLTCATMTSSAPGCTTIECPFATGCADKAEIDAEKHEAKKDRAEAEADAKKAKDEAAANKVAPGKAKSDARAAAKKAKAEHLAAKKAVAEAKAAAEEAKTDAEKDKARAEESKSVAEQATAELDAAKARIAAEQAEVEKQAACLKDCGEDISCKMNCL